MRIDSEGFSLLELLIVVAIILIIAAIVIPNFMRSGAASQASAVGALRALNTAEFTYASTCGKGYNATLGYRGLPSSIAPANVTHAGIVDSVLSDTAASGPTAMPSIKSGYRFTYSPGTIINGQIVSYPIYADPHQPRG